MSSTTLSLLGATGGAGTTRTTLELATILAADGADVAVLDAAYDTQGLARHLSGRLRPDLTSLVTDETDRPLADGFVAFDPMAGDTGALAAEGDSPAETPPPAPGRVACCPANAPFERLARAKTADAAQAFERRVEEASDAFDYVLVDTPPLGSNPAVAAVTAADRVAVVTPTTAHGLDAVQAARARLQDVGTGADAVLGVARRGEDTGDEVAGDVDALFPALDSDVPACLDSPDGLTALATVAEVTLGRTVGLEPADQSVLDRVQSLR
jgi:septum site-determining protein MinD